MNRIGRIAAIAACAALALSGACARRTVAVEYRLEKGEELRYSMKTRGDGVTRMPALTERQQATEVPSKIEMDLVWRMKVTDRDARGVATIEALFETFALEMESGGMRIRVEADESGARLVQGETVMQDAPGLEELKDAFRNPSVVTMDKRGRILSIDAPGGAGALMPHTDLNAFLKESQFVIPEGPIAIGRSWRESRDLPVGEALRLPEGKEIRLDTRYTLAGVVTRAGREWAEIAVDGKAEAKALEAELPQAGRMKIVFDRLLQAVSGTVYFDLERGCVAEAAMETKSEQEVTRIVRRPGSDEEVRLPTVARMTMASEIKLLE
ncbi:MAG: hypothetical protein PHN82_09360 [bacterium]|nr:hypothetical protein [bacterium]